MNQDITPTVRAWLHDTVSSAPPPVDLDRAVATAVQRTPQRHGWWGRLRSGRSLRRRSPITASNTQIPTVTGRTQSMISPVKAITAAALVFAIGGVLFVAQPFQQESSAPGAEAEAPIPVDFATTFSTSGQASPGVTETLANGVVRHSSVAWRGASSEASDPRFAGTYVWTITWDTYPDGAEFNTGAARITNDDGAWQQVPVQFFNWTDGRDTPSDIPMATGETAQRVFVGEDGYEGLVAVVVETPQTSTVWNFEGYILDGELPPLPEPYVAE